MATCTIFSKSLSAKLYYKLKYNLFVLGWDFMCLFLHFYPGIFLNSVFHDRDKHKFAHSNCVTNNIKNLLRHVLLLYFLFSKFSIFFTLTCSLQSELNPLFIFLLDSCSLFTKLSKKIEYTFVAL
jgi:hypothetical protein